MSSFGDDYNLDGDQLATPLRQNSTRCEQVSDNRLESVSNCLRLPILIGFERTTIRKYEEKYIEKSNLIGSGTFGNVYKGILIEIKRLIAIKEKKKNQHDNIQSLNRKTQKEGEKMAGLNHENVIKLIGYCNRVNDTTLLLMEFCDGGSLRSFLNEYDLKSDIYLPLRVQISWLKQITHGMEYMSSRNTIHGDLKADNIVLSHRPKFSDEEDLLDVKLKIIDFSEAFGTPSHMSPEAMDEKLHIKSDVWSFGVVIYEIATLLKPFDEYISTVVLCYDVGVKKKTIDFPECVEPSLLKLAKKCFEYEPDNRISFEEIILEFDSIEELEWCQRAIIPNGLF